MLSLTFCHLPHSSALSSCFCATWGNLWVWTKGPSSSYPMHGEKQAPRIKSWPSTQKPKPKWAGSFRGVFTPALQSKLLKQKLMFSLLVCPQQGKLEVWVQMCLLPASENGFEHLSVLGERAACGHPPTELFCCQPDHCQSSSAASYFKWFIWRPGLKPLLQWGKLEKTPADTKHVPIRMPWNCLSPKKSLNNLLFKKKTLKMKINKKCINRMLSIYHTWSS